jgi:hypothetical protein
MAVQNPPPIDPVPTPPIQRGDRATFSSRVDAFIMWLTTAVSQFRAVAVNVAANANDAASSATSAGTAKTGAETARTGAETARTGAETARSGAETARTGAETARDAALNNVSALTATSTSSHTIGTGAKTFSVPAGKQFIANENVYIVDPANGTRWMAAMVNSYSGTSLAVTVLAVNPATAGQPGSNWAITVSGVQGPPGPTGGGLTGGNLDGALNELRSATVPVSTSPDIWSPAGNLIPLVGSGNITNFPPAPQAGAKRTLVMAQSGQTATIQTNANMIVFGGAQTVRTNDELDVTAITATFFRVRIRRADGKATVGSRTVVQVLTSSQMWNVPATDFEVEICGGGQNGMSSSSPGGACGAYAKKQFSGAVIGSTASVVVGVGGAATTNGTRNNGGDSSFTLTGFTTISCSGGKDGAMPATGGDINIAGVVGDAYSVSGVSLSGNNFVAVYRSGSGASGQMGNGAPCGSGTLVDGSGYGAGGAGVQGSTNIPGDYVPVLVGSAGRPGVCIIRYQV